MSASARAADRIAADWQDVVDAVRKAGGDAVVISALDLSLLLTGFAQYRAERNAALAELEAMEKTGAVDDLVLLDMRRALGVIDQEQYVQALRQSGPSGESVACCGGTGYADHAAVPCTAPRCPAQVEAP